MNVALPLGSTATRTADALPSTGERLNTVPSAPAALRARPCAAKVEPLLRNHVNVALPPESTATRGSKAPWPAADNVWIEPSEPSGARRRVCTSPFGPVEPQPDVRRVPRAVHRDPGDVAAAPVGRDDLGELVHADGRAPALLDQPGREGGLRQTKLASPFWFTATCALSEPWAAGAMASAARAPRAARRARRVADMARRYSVQSDTENLHELRRPASRGRGTRAARLRDPQLHSRRRCSTGKSVRVRHGPRRCNQGA